MRQVKEGRKEEKAVGKTKRGGETEQVSKHRTIMQKQKWK